MANIVIIAALVNLEVNHLFGPLFAQVVGGAHLVREWVQLTFTQQRDDLDAAPLEVGQDGFEDLGRDHSGLVPEDYPREAVQFVPEGRGVPSRYGFGHRQRQQLVECGRSTLEIVRVLNGQLVGVAGNHKVDAGGDQGQSSDGSLAASALTRNQEPLDCCEQYTSEFARNSIRMDSGDLPRVSR